MIELATLPPIIQSYIKDNGAVELRLEQGKVIATPKRIERPFNFEIDEIQKAIDSGFKPMPEFNNDEEFLAWANA